MNTSIQLGKRQASVPFDSPSQAHCIGPDCRRTPDACPGHEFRAYAALAAKHKVEVAA